MLRLLQNGSWLRINLHLLEVEPKYLLWLWRHVVGCVSMHTCTYAYTHAHTDSFACTYLYIDITLFLLLPVEFCVRVCIQSFSIFSFIGWMLKQQSILESVIALTTCASMHIPFWVYFLQSCSLTPSCALLTTKNSLYLPHSSVTILTTVYFKSIQCQLAPTEDTTLWMCIQSVVSFGVTAWCMFRHFCEGDVKIACMMPTYRKCMWSCTLKVHVCNSILSLPSGWQGLACSFHQKLEICLCWDKGERVMVFYVEQFSMQVHSSDVHY